MERILLFIKHHFGFLWGIIEWSNGIVFSFIYGSRLSKVLPEIFSETDRSGFIFRKITYHDLQDLYELLNTQDPGDIKYFSPHKFDKPTLERLLKNPSFLMMGAFEDEKLTGYFFLRFFVNRKCFVGRLIDRPYRGKGIGLTMNKIMYETAWRMGFRCLSTISRENSLVMKAHARNSNMVVVKELGKGYVLVEFVRKDGGTKGRRDGDRYSVIGNR